MPKKKKKDEAKLESETHTDSKILPLDQPPCFYHYVPPLYPSLYNFYFVSTILFSVEPFFFLEFSEWEVIKETIFRCLGQWKQWHWSARNMSTPHFCLRHYHTVHPQFHQFFKHSIIEIPWELQRCLFPHLEWFLFLFILPWEPALTLSTPPQPDLTSSLRLALMVFIT